MTPTDPAPRVTPLQVRAMRDSDVDEAERLSTDAFRSLELATRPIDWPVPGGRDETAAAAWRDRLRHLLSTDPGGCWVAERDGRLVGSVSSMRRETLVGLSTYFLRDDQQGRGVGRALLEAALTHSQGAVRGLICSTHDPRAARRYRAAGFVLHPSMHAYGVVERSVLPVVDHVRVGSAGDLDLADSLDRATRGAGHGPDHAHLVGRHPLLVVDDSTGQGYCYVARTGGPYLLAASNQRTAQRLMWESLAHSRPDVPVQVRYVSAENAWAVDVAFAARLELYARGYLAYRFMKPAAPYLPSVHFC